MKKIVFLDVDGTLVDVPRGLAEPSNLTKYAIKELINNGDLVFIASGRFIGNLPPVIKELNPSGYVISNGAYIEYQGSKLYEKEFDPDIFDSLEKFCLEHNCLFFGETRDFLYTPVIDDKFKGFMKKWKTDFVKMTDKKEGVSFYKCVAHFVDRSDATLFEKTFNGVVDYRAQTADPDNLSYDINLIGINKGSAVKEVIKKLGINPENTYCFCDGSNDIELAKACKYSFALSNGDEYLKKIAYGVAGDVLEDGVYHKLVELGLIKEKQ